MTPMTTTEQTDTYRVIVRYTVERAIYVDAANRRQAKERAKDTGHWTDEFETTAPGAVGPIIVVEASQR